MPSTEKTLNEKRALVTVLTLFGKKEFHLGLRFIQHTDWGLVGHTSPHFRSSGPFCGTFKRKAQRGCAVGFYFNVHRPPFGGNQHHLIDRTHLDNSGRLIPPHHHIISLRRMNINVFPIALQSQFRALWPKPYTFREFFGRLTVRFPKKGVCKSVGGTIHILPLKRLT